MARGYQPVYYKQRPKGLCTATKDPEGQGSTVRIVGPDGTYNEDNCANRF